MIEILQEKFSDKLPSWLTNVLSMDRNRRGFSYYDNKVVSKLGDAKIEWDKAEYVKAPIPTSARASDYKDPSRLPVFKIKTKKWDGTDRIDVYIPGITNPDLYGDVVDMDAYSVPCSKIPYKKLYKVIDEYGYINIPEYSTISKRRDRATAKAGSIDRNLKRGQVRRKMFGSDEYKWLTDKGYDKSGYELTPDKYKNMLAKMDASNTKAASARIERYYNQIEELKVKVAQTLLDNTSKDLGNKASNGKSSFSSNRFEDVSDALQYLNKAIYSYKHLLKSVEDLNKSKGQEGDKESLQRWISHDLKRYGEEIKEYIQRAKDALSE